jgi:predicted DNA-binding transcriptional regulator AlpA
LEGVAAGEALSQLYSASRLFVNFFQPSFKLAVTSPAHDSSADTDRLLTAEAVAHLLGVTKRWVLRRARRLPFARHISVRSVRYSEAGLRRWMMNRQMQRR